METFNHTHTGSGRPHAQYTQASTGKTEALQRMAYHNSNASFPHVTSFGSPPTPFGSAQEMNSRNSEANTQHHRVPTSPGRRTISSGARNISIQKALASSPNRRVKRRTAIAGFVSKLHKTGKTKKLKIGGGANGLSKIASMMDFRRWQGSRSEDPAGQQPLLPGQPLPGPSHTFDPEDQSSGDVDEMCDCDSTCQDAHQDPFRTPPRTPTLPSDSRSSLSVEDSLTVDLFRRRTKIVQILGVESSAAVERDLSLLVDQPRV